MKCRFAPFFILADLTNWKTNVILITGNRRINQPQLRVLGLKIPTFAGLFPPNGGDVAGKRWHYKPMTDWER
jgi:hypothetical protein